MIGFPAPAADHRDYLPVKILNAHLGGGMSARLFQDLRERNALAYDVGSFFATRLGGSSFVIYLGLQANRLAEAYSKIRPLLAEIPSMRFWADFFPIRSSWET